MNRKPVFCLIAATLISLLITCQDSLAAGDGPNSVLRDGDSQVRGQKKREVHRKHMKHKRHRRSTRDVQKPIGGTMKKAGEFNGDLRSLPKTPPKETGTAPVRQAPLKPRPYPTPTPEQKQK